MFGAESFDTRADEVADFARAREFLLGRPGQRGGIGKAPVKPPHIAGKNRASLRARLVAHRYDVGKFATRVEHAGDGFRGVMRDVDARLGHRFDDDRIQPARLDAGALGGEDFPAVMIEKRLGHLRAGAVVDADEKDAGLHGPQSGATRDGEASPRT